MELNATQKKICQVLNKEGLSNPSKVQYLDFSKQQFIKLVEKYFPKDLIEFEQEFSQVKEELFPQYLSRIRDFCQ